MASRQPLKTATGDGRLLRANGRYTITHRWEMGTDELRTACGLVYVEDEIYDGDTPAVLFVHASRDDPPFLRCGKCFSDGTAKTIVVKE